MTPRNDSESVGAAGDELIAIARIARPHGLRGEVVADIMTDFPDRFAGLASVCLRLSSGEVVERRLERSRLHQGRVVFKLAGCDRIEDAEQYRGIVVLIKRGELVELPPDNYYDFDLVDCQVIDLRAGQTEAESDRLIAEPVDSGPSGKSLDGSSSGLSAGSAVKSGTDVAGRPCEVAGRVIGRVVGVEHFGAAPLLIVVTPEGREHLIPLASSICVEIDIQRKQILVDPPEGLLD